MRASAIPPLMSLRDQRPCPSLVVAIFPAATRPSRFQRRLPSRHIVGAGLPRRQRISARHRICRQGILAILGDPPLRLWDNFACRHQNPTGQGLCLCTFLTFVFQTPCNLPSRLEGAHRASPHPQPFSHREKGVWNPLPMGEGRVRADWENPLLAMTLSTEG